jgi:hypothetical protein
MGPGNHGLNPLDLWAKINLFPLLSFFSQVLGCNDDKSN